MPAILVIAHPGHELRVHGWLETTRPEVWVLTDGSGRTGRSRIDSTTRVLEATGATRGRVYGRMSDIDLYNAALNSEYGAFTNLVDELADVLLQDDVDCIAGDAEEGYNPAHDTCRLIINAAAMLVNRRVDKQIRNYDFTLVGAPERGSEVSVDSLWLNLDEAAFARKLSAALNYPELHAEVEGALNGKNNGPLGDHSDLAERSQSAYGVTQTNNFRVECLRLVNSHARAPFAEQPPFYEEYGARQVKAGHYTHVLRYREHMLPLAAALEDHAKRNS